MTAFNPKRTHDGTPVFFPVLLCKVHPHVSCGVTSCPLSCFPSIVIVLVSYTCPCVFGPCDFLLLCLTVFLKFPLPTVLNELSLPLYLSSMSSPLCQLVCSVSPCQSCIRHVTVCLFNLLPPEHLIFWLTSSALVLQC